MASIDQNGIPSVVAAESTETGRVIGAAVTVPVTPSATYGSIAAALLDEMEAAAVIIIDPNSRTVYAASSTAGTALETAVDSACEGSADITPDVGQEGRSLTYDFDCEGFAYEDAIRNTLGTAKPRRTVQSLISQILSYSEFGTILPVFGIDQATGNVKVWEVPAVDDVVTTLADVEWDEDLNQARIDLSEPSVEDEPDPIIFEGGPTS